MKNEENSLIATTIAIIIINTIVYLFNKTYLDICSISSLMFYGSIIIGIISIILIRKNLDKYKNVIYFITNASAPVVNLPTSEPITIPGSLDSRVKSFKLPAKNPTTCVNTILHPALL